MVYRSIVGLVVEFVVAIDEARVRFTDDAFLFALFIFSFPAPHTQTTTELVFCMVSFSSPILLNCRSEPIIKTNPYC